MPTAVQHTITMYILDPVNGTLRLSPPSTEVDPGDSVSWVMDPKIESFQLIKKPGTTHDIFTKPLPTTPVTGLNLTVRSVLSAGDWFYSILWIDKATHHSHVFDPKITVKPGLFNFKPLVILMVSTVIGLLSILFFRKKRNSR